MTQSITADSGIAVKTLCTNCNNADLSIAGSGNEHVSLVCDGMPVPSGLAQIYLLSVMPPTRIDTIDVSRGAGDVGYGGSSIGGGIEVERAVPPNGFRLNASGDAGSYDSKGLRLDLSGKSGWFGGYGVGTFATSDKIDANGDGWANLPEYDRYTIEAGLEMTPGETHRVRIGASTYNEDQLDGPANAFYYTRKVCVGLDQVIGTGYGGECTTSDFNVAYNREDVQLARTQFEGLYDLSVGKGGTLSLVGVTSERSQDIQETQSFFDQNINLLLPGDEERLMDDYGLTPSELEEILGITLGQPEQQLLEETYNINEEGRHGAVKYSQPLGHQAMLRAGVASTDTAFDVVDVHFNRLKSSIDNDPLPPFPLDFKLQEDQTETGAWVEGETALGSRLELSAGLRYVDYTYEDNLEEEVAFLGGYRSTWLEVPLPEGNRVVPRAALSWKVVDSFQLRVSAGAGLRAPAPAFDKVCCGRRYRGNRGVYLEESESAGLEALYQPGPRFKVAGSFFVSNFDNMIINMATKSQISTHVYQNVNVTEARKKALSVEGRFQAPMWMTTRVSYTWVDAENLTPGNTISALIDDGGEVPDAPLTFHYDGIPYINESQGAIGFDFVLPPLVTLNFTAQYTGPMLIQSFEVPDDVIPNDPSAYQAGVSKELSKTAGFWVGNLRMDKAFRNGIALFAGVDNVLDYVQGDGCSLDSAQANPALIGCLGDPRYDYNWGPLRGRYYYAGIGYNFTK